MDAIAKKKKEEEEKRNTVINHNQKWKIHIRSADNTYHKLQKPQRTHTHTHTNTHTHTHTHTYIYAHAHKHTHTEYDNLKRGVSRVALKAEMALDDLILKGRVFQTDGAMKEKSHLTKNMQRNWRQRMEVSEDEHSCCLVSNFLWVQPRMMKTCVEQATYAKLASWFMTHSRHPQNVDNTRYFILFSHVPFLCRSLRTWSWLVCH